MTYPSLSLPHALIDDYAMLENSEQWTRLLAEGRVQEAIRSDLGIQAKVRNLGFTLGNAARYRLTGSQPYHWIRLIQLAFLCAAIFTLLHKAFGKTLTSFLGSMSAIVLFLSLEVPTSVDMQCLRANWLRLFTADPDALTFLSVQMLAIFALYLKQNSLPTRFLVTLVAIAAGSIVACIKIPYIALVCCPPLALALCAWIYKEKTTTVFLALISIFTAGVFLTYYNLLSRYLPADNGQSYAESYSLKIPHLMEGLEYYATACWNMMGLLLPALATGATLLLCYLLKHWKENKVAVGVYLYIVLFIALGFGMYLPWNHRLPRYMLAGTVGLTMMSGLVIIYGLRGLVNLWASQKKAFLFFPAGMAVAVCSPIILLITLGIAVIITLWKKSSLVIPYIMGIAFVGTIYLIVTIPSIRSATNTYYIGREFANWDATKTVMQFSVQGKSVCFAGNAQDEHIGSMAGHIRRMGIQPQIYALSDAVNCTSDSLVMVHSILSSSQDREKFINRPELLEKEIALPVKSIQVPVSYWNFRSRLFDNTPGASWTDTWNSDFVWRFYRQH